MTLEAASFSNLDKYPSFPTPRVGPVWGLLYGVPQAFRQDCIPLAHRKTCLLADCILASFLSPTSLPYSPTAISWDHFPTQLPALKSLSARARQVSRCKRCQAKGSIWEIVLKSICPAFSPILSIRSKNVQPTQNKQTRTTAIKKISNICYVVHKGHVLIVWTGLCKCVSSYIAGFKTTFQAEFQLLILNLRFA